MKTIVLDDDPTGTQSATGVTVLFDSTTDLLTKALQAAPSVYVQTNSRALSEKEAVALARKIKNDGESAAERLGEQVRFVLRGDSTLRGHVFPETEVFLSDDAVILFVPAFPEGGRTTRDGIHYVRIEDKDIPAHETEYSQDPVFAFSSGILAEYVAEKSSRTPVLVTADQVRNGELTQIIAEAPAGSVIVPDAANAGDISDIAKAVDAVTAMGRHVVVRSAAPLAAELAGVASTRLLPTPIVDFAERVLIVCGSHTQGATSQLKPIEASWGNPAVIHTATALDAPSVAGLESAEATRLAFDGKPVAILTTERQRFPEHNTLIHGENVMTALTTAVRSLLPGFNIVVAKGGITSAEVARTGIGSKSALVLGQVLPGISVWQMTDRAGREILYVVVPGNVGGPDTLVGVLKALNILVPDPV